MLAMYQIVALCAVCTADLAGICMQDHFIHFLFKACSFTQARHVVVAGERRHHHSNCTNACIHIYMCTDLDVNRLACYAAMQRSVCVACASDPCTVQHTYLARSSPPVYSWSCQKHKAAVLVAHCQPPQKRHHVIGAVVGVSIMFHTAGASGSEEAEGACVE